MPTLTNILLLLVAGFLLAITPGPDMLYVVTRSVSGGRRAGVATVMGIATISFLRTCAIALGLAGLLLAIPVTYEIMKYLGALYLVSLGVRLLFQRQELSQQAREEQRLEKNEEHWHKSFLQGAFTTLLNPKPALFFLFFLPQFVSPTQGNIAEQLFILGLLYNLTGSTVEMGIALLASSLSKRLAKRFKGSKAVKWLTGGVMIGLGIRLALMQRQ